jgi:long-subunit acyl-CoA synthetase (AMP-forming)
VIGGPGVISTYPKNPEADATAFVDSWFRSGDLDVLVEGRLRLEGRLEEIIMRGGENISLREVEKVLLRPGGRRCSLFWLRG